MGKKGERGARDKAAALEEEARNAARKAEHGEEEYQCVGILEQDFTELCTRAGFQEIPKVVLRPHGHPVAVPEETDPQAEQSILAQIQCKYAYFRPTIQVEQEHEDPKSAREVFLRGWKVEEKMLSVLAKCLPALGHLQAIHLWKVGLTDLTFASLLTILPSCASLKMLALEGNPLPERSFYKLISEDSPLAHLFLRNNEMDDEAAGLIGRALASLKSSHQGLASLSLSCNHITDVGAAHLANGLRLNRSLLSLSLASNRIGDEGALKLAEVLGPFALTHAEVVERRRLLLEKEAQERVRLPQRQADVKSERPSSHVSNTAIDKLQPAKAAKSLNKKKELAAKKEEKEKEKEKGLLTGGGAMVQAAAAAQAKKEEAKQAKKAAPATEQKPVRGKGTKSGPKDKRAQILEVEVSEPTEAVNPLLEQAEHRDGKVFLPGNHVLLYLNLMRNQITEEGLKAFLAVVEQQSSRGAHGGGKGPTGLLHLSLGKNHYPADSKTFARIQELMATRDPLPKAGARVAAEEDLAASGT
ncbi:leucine-rich repeat-containing protein 71 isoform X4 [Pogona vitticeps]|uniref:Leucine-rich repeat-containing protein 71 isoform X1 n=1 Tax=Pogona vitticeps TaxID=103695 RepID=A0ABM5F4C8_9SAUR